MEKRICTICQGEFKPCKPTSTTCSPKCRNAETSRKSAEKRGNTLRGRGDDRTYTKEGGRHQHRIVMEKMLGRSLLPGEVVHHKDKNKKNNSPENLELTTQSEHCREHARKDKKCEIEGCDRKHAARGMCKKHYLQWWYKNKGGNSG